MEVDGEPAAALPPQPAAAMPLPQRLSPSDLRRKIQHQDSVLANNEEQRAKNDSDIADAKKSVADLSAQLQAEVGAEEPSAGDGLSAASDTASDQDGAETHAGRMPAFAAAAAAATPQQVLEKLTKLLDLNKLMLAVEEQCVSSEAYAQMCSAMNTAAAQTVGMRQNEPGCPKPLPPADVLQQNKNDINRLFQLLNPQRARRNPGCMLGLREVLRLLAEETMADGETMYVKKHIDGNTHNGHKRLYVGLCNMTDHVKTAANPTPQLKGYQDPTSTNQMDLSCYVTDSTLKDKDLEGPEVLRKNLEHYDTDIEPLTAGTFVMLKIRKLQLEINKLLTPKRPRNEERSKARAHAKRLEQDRLRQEAQAAGQMLDIVDAHGRSRWVFVWLEAVPDMKGLKAALGMEDCGPTTSVCPVCRCSDADIQHAHNCHKGEARGWTATKAAQDALEGALYAMWPSLPLSRWRCCVLHADCRVTEKLLHQLTVTVWTAMQRCLTGHTKHGVVMSVKVAFLQVLADCGVNGGYVDIKEINDVRTGLPVLYKFSLNGQDARRVKSKWQDLLKALEPLSTVFCESSVPPPGGATAKAAASILDARGRVATAASSAAAAGSAAAPADEAAAPADAAPVYDVADPWLNLCTARAYMWAQWQACGKWFSRHTMTELDYDLAASDLRAFVKLYRKCPSEVGTAARITHYIHVIEAHTDWFLGKGSPMSPALVSTQCMEHKHKFRNLFLRSCTMHGKAIEVDVFVRGEGGEGGEGGKWVKQKITSAPEIWQYLQKEHQLFKLRQRVRRQSQVTKHVVAISALACLDASTQVHFTEANIRQALGLWPAVPVHITGHGDQMCTGKVLTVTSMTVVARDKLVGGRNIVTDGVRLLNNNKKRTAEQAAKGQARKKARVTAGAANLQLELGLDSRAAEVEAMGWKPQLQPCSPERAARTAAAAATAAPAAAPAGRDWRQLGSEVVSIEPVRKKARGRAGPSQGGAGSNSRAKGHGRGKGRGRGQGKKGSTA